jgi:hypothetical protein
LTGLREQGQCPPLTAVISLRQAVAILHFQS